MRSLSLLAAGVALAALLPISAAAQPAPFDSLAIVAAAQRHVDTLAAPAMHGRGYLHGGHERAAAYLVEQFREIGLEPVGGSYTQPFPLRVGTFPEAPELVVDGRSLELGDAFVPSRAAASGAGSGRVVDVGAGLHLSAWGIDEMSGRDLKGAVAVLRERVPEEVARNDSIPAETYALPARIEAVRQAGAQAVVVLSEPLTFGGHFFDVALPVLLVAADQWPDDARTVRYRVRHDRGQTVRARNVMGRIEGTERPDSLLLVMAHYDHLGALGESVFFPGANDNASGVAALLELARYFSEHPPRYSVLFVAFSGEEVGLVGSRYFAARPPADLDRVRFLLNFDMVASGRNGVMAVAGRDFPGAYNRLQAISDSLGSGPLAARPNAPNSDHYFLIEAGAPGFYLYTRDGTQPYHHVDDVPETLEWNDWWQVYHLARLFLQSF